MSYPRSSTGLTFCGLEAAGRQLARAVLYSVLCVLLIGVLMSATPKSAAAAEPKFGGVLRAAMTANVPTLDPHAITAVSTREVALHIFESLVTFDENFRIIPQLAAKWDISKDGKAYTFYLRKGVLFHNGKEMKAEDVLASVERFRKYAPRRAELSAVAGIDIVDDYTIRFRLSQPTGAFLAVLGNPSCQLAIFPKEVVENKELNKVDIVGTGPYRFVEWIPDRHVRIKRFEKYVPWGGPASGLGGGRVAYLDEILFVPVPEPGARVAGLETGEYDFADSIPPTSLPTLTKRSGLKMVQLKPYTYPVTYINHARQFKNVKMRQALQAALNHEEIMLVVAEGAGRLDPGHYFREQIWYSDAGKELYNQNDAKKAKALLQEAGYKGEQIILVTNSDYDYMYKSALVILQQLKKAGMNIKLEVYDYPGAVAARNTGNWDLYISSRSTRFDPTANDWEYTASATFFGYNNPKAEQLMKKAGAVVDFDERYQTYVELQKLLYDDVCFIKLFDLHVNQGYQQYVQDYVPWVLPHFWNVWLDKPGR